MKTLATLTLATLLITGCSTKKYFEPEDTTDISTSKSALSSDIKSINRSGATLEDGKFVSELGSSSISLKKGFYFLNTSSDNQAISTNYKDTLMIADKEYKINNVVIAASKKDNLIALIYSDNSLELRDENNKILYKDYQSLSLANDTRITNPFFLGNLVLFPALDGKIVIASINTKETVKKISVDPDGQFNNIIYLDVMDDGQTLVSATANKLVSISATNINIKDYEIKDVAIDGEIIYIATLDGKIIKLNKNLEELASKKFKFAKLNAIALSKDDLYAVESQGYLIKISKDFKTALVDDFSYDESDKIISLRNKFYTANKIISLP